MNSNQFREEIISFIDQSYNEFNEYKDIIKSMFRVVHEICKKNSIKYYYGFGSLLGVIRDKGMIPWDADIDILVPISEMPHFIETLKKELPSNFYIVSDFIDKNYYLCETRICSKNYDSNIIHIDVFYLIGAPKKESKLRKFDKKVKKLYYRRALRYEKIVYPNNRRDKIIYYIKKMYQVLCKLKPNFIFNIQCKKILWKYSNNNSEKWIVWAEGGEVFPKSIFGEPVLCEEDGIECYLPVNANKFLKIRYGNYQNYAPIMNRFEEFYSGFKRFIKSKEDFKQ